MAGQTQSTDDLPERVSFIKFEATKVHRAFTVPTNYDKSHDIFVPPKKPSRFRAKRTIDVDLKDLEKAIAEYESSQAEENIQSVTFDSENCSWEAVFKQMDDVKVKYEERDNGGLGFFRKLWRKAGENKENIDPWLDFIPDENGLKILRNGIVVILTLAQKTVEHREKMLNAIIEVVDIVTRASPKRKIFNFDDTLDDCIQKLYVAVLDAVATIIQYLLQKTEKAKFLVGRGKSIFKKEGSRPKQIRKTLDHIDLAVTNVKVKATDFSELYSNFKDELFLDNLVMQEESQEIVSNIDSKTTHISKETSQIKTTVDKFLPAIGSNTQATKNVVKIVDKRTVEINNTLLGVDSQLQQQGSELKEINQTINTGGNMVVRDIGKLMQAQEERNRRELREQEARSRKQMKEQEDRFAALMREQQERHGIDAQNLFNAFLRSHEKSRENAEFQSNNYFGSITPVNNRSQTPVPRAVAVITLEQLIDILGIPFQLANDDLERAISQRDWFDESAHSSAQSLLSTPQFCNWLVDGNSSLLLADGCDEEHATDSLSAMSLLCVSVIGSLVGSRSGRQIVTLHFFCGLHCDEGEGPKFMLRSLIMQVLLALRTHRCLDLNFIEDERHLRDLQDSDWASLMYTFRRLMQQFPPYLTVYCLIDGVASYESRWLGFQFDMMALVDELKMLVWPRQMTGPQHYCSAEDQYYKSVRCNFKILLTSANGTDCLYERIDKFSQWVSIGSDYVGSLFTSDEAVQDSIAQLHRRPTFTSRGYIR